MKKIIFAFAVLLILSGCSVKKYTPSLNTDFSVEAVYQTGDFSYNADIVKDGENVSVQVESSSAKGVIITYDGSEITFSQDEMKASFQDDKTNKTNPAVVIYEIFDYIENNENLQCSRCDVGYEYKGNISVGEFTFTQNEDETFNTIVLPQADIKITFM